MPNISLLRERAQCIEADALVEEHGDNAYEVVFQLEQTATSIGTERYWHGVKKIVAAKIGVQVDILLPTLDWQEETRATFPEYDRLG